MTCSLVAEPVLSHGQGCTETVVLQKTQNGNSSRVEDLCGIALAGFVNEINFLCKTSMIP